MLIGRACATDVAQRRLGKITGPYYARKIAAKQRQPGAFNGYVGPGAHGDSDIGSRQRRRIIDAVAGHRQCEVR